MKQRDHLLAVDFHTNPFMKMPFNGFFLLVITALGISGCADRPALVFQSDFGLKDGAVSALKGVAYSVSPGLSLYDITHEIPPFNILEAAYRLNQVADYWPAGTVFVSIVDPGVGTERKSIVLKTKTGRYFVSPDNGTLTFIAQSQGVEQVREIDESKNRLPGSESSHTFHGRDVYAYTGARLAGGTISFEDTGPILAGGMVRLEVELPRIENRSGVGIIPVLDIQYGNIWTNIDARLLKQLDIKTGDLVQVQIFNRQEQVYEGTLPMVQTFARVEKGEAMCYLNSLQSLSIGINQGNFAERFKIGSGVDWAVKVMKQ